MRAHWEKQKCYAGKAPNAEGTRKSLKAEQIRLHSQLKRSTALAAQQMVQQIFPLNCEVVSGDFHYCINCGAFSKRLNNIKRHFGTRNKELPCNSSLHLSRSKGKVSKGLHGFQCPSAIVEQIQSRQFTLPYEHPVSTINQPLTTAHITTMARVSKSALMEACIMRENGRMAKCMEWVLKSALMEAWCMKEN